MPLNAMNARDISPAIIKPLGTPRMDLNTRDLEALPNAGHQYQGQHEIPGPQQRSTASR